MRRGPANRARVFLRLAFFGLVFLGLNEAAPAFSTEAKGEDYNLRRDPLKGMSYLQESLCRNAIESGNPEYIKVGCGNTNIAWYTDRDNSMSDAEPEIQKAMVVVFAGMGAILQGIQVCPGVYLTTAHGVLEDPNQVRTKVGPGSYRTSVVAYPMKVENIMLAEQDKNFISPRLRKPKLWNKDHPDFHSSDYVFIKVDNPLRPKNFVRLVRASFAELKGQDVHLYRGKSRYKKQGEQGLNFSEGEAIPRDPELLVPIYKSPQKVNQPCALNGQKGPFIFSDCPTEASVSGSPYILKNQGKSYVVGMVTMSILANLEATKTVKGSPMLKASEFCEDYKKACGQPCGKLGR